MKKFFIFLFLSFSLLCNAQWTYDISTSSPSLKHKKGWRTDAIYHLDPPMFMKNLTIISDVTYNKIHYDKGVKNGLIVNNKIRTYTDTVKVSFYQNNEFDTSEFVPASFSFGTFGIDDPKNFTFTYDLDVKLIRMKAYSYIVFEYTEPIGKKKVKQKLSLSGFTKALKSLIELYE